MKAEPLSRAYTATRWPEQTALHISACGVRAVDWGLLQRSVSQAADVRRGGAFSQGIHEDVQSCVVAHGELGD